MADDATWARSRQNLLRLARRGVWAAAGAVAGALFICVWRHPLLEVHAERLQAVHTLRASVQRMPFAAQAVQALPSPEALAGLARLPAVRDAAGLWPVLQQGLQQQGLHVQSLRPQVLQAGGALASQALALRVQGRWSDWASAWDALLDAGPVWTMDRLSVSGAGPGGPLQWDGLWRVWLRPDAASGEAWPALWDTAQRSGPHRAVDHQLPELAMAVRSADSLTLPAPLSADPREWPLAQIRLWGVGWDGDKRLAVLGVGTHWAAVAIGDQLAREAYRVKAIHPDALELQSLQRPSQVQVLRLQGGEP